MGKIKLESCSLTRARIHVIPRRAKRTFPLSAHKFENNDDNDTATRPKWQGARGEEQNVAAAKHLVAAASSSSCVSTVPDTRMNLAEDKTSLHALLVARKPLKSAVALGATSPRSVLANVKLPTGQRRIATNAS